MSKNYEQRKYQERTIEAFNKWISTPSKLATIILPVGTGKTFTCSMCLNNIPGSKILWTAHREELIDQAFITLTSVITWTNNIQKEIAENKADPNSDIIVGSIQTLYRKRPHLETFIPDIIVIDEYHHMSEKNSTYKSLLDRYPNAKVIGLTATPWRFSGDPLPLGDVLFEMDIGTAISHNYLVPAIPEILKSNVSLANVKTQMGDFAINELSKTINTEDRNKLIAKRIIELVKDNHRQGILFGASIEHATSMFELIKNEIRAAEIYGETPKEQRRYLIDKARNGEIDCLVNNLCLTEGFDIPHLSFAVMARPTRSLSLFIQGTGRVLRKSLGKENAIIVDVYDKLKIRQSRITFHDMANHGDMYGEKKRANNILTADIEWNGTKKSKNSDDIAKILKNFPVFMISEKNEKWTTDDSFIPITSWIIANDQRLITWTEEQSVQTMVQSSEWKPLATKPTLSVIKQIPIKVKHNIYGEGKIIDLGTGDNVKVEFESDGWGPGRHQIVSVSSLLVHQGGYGLTQGNVKIKKDRVFYLCFPEGESEGRMVEFEKEKNDLLIIKDKRVNINKAKEYIVSIARSAGILPLVRSDAKWKQAPASINQKNLIQKMIDDGKIRFDIDLDTMTKGDASAIIEQVKWQKIIHQKFGATSKNKLLGYNNSNEDV